MSISLIEINKIFERLFSVSIIHIIGPIFI